jgi:hypothetical protein
MEGCSVMAASLKQHLRRISGNARSAHAFLGTYGAGAVIIFAMLLGGMHLVHDKTGPVPLLIGLLFYYPLTYLMCSVPIVFGVVGRGMGTALKY